MVNSLKTLEKILDNTPCGLGVFEIKDKKIYLDYLNPGYYKLIGDTRQERTQYIGYSWVKAVYPEDIPLVMAAADDILIDDVDIDLTLRIINGKQEYTWIRAMVNAVTEEAGTRFIYCNYVNAEAQMAAEIQLRTSQALFESAMHNMNMSPWEYDFRTKTAYLTTVAQRQHGLDRVIHNMPDSLIERDFIHPDSVAEYRRIFSGEFENKQPIKADIYAKNANRDGYWWARYVMTPVYDDNGNLIKAVGTSVDITEEKKSEERYRQQLALLDSANSVSLIAKVRYDLTKNTLIYYDRIDENSVSSELVYTYDEGLKATADTFIYDDDRRRFLKIFNRQHLISEFSKGNNLFYIEYRRRSKKGDTIWVRTEVRTAEEPVSGHIVSFTYSFDITSEKTAEEVIHKVASMDYDFIVLLNCKTCLYSTYQKSGIHSTIYDLQNIDYKLKISDNARYNVREGEEKHYLKTFSLDNIKRQLENEKIFTVVWDIKNDEGIFRRKKVQFSYLDSTKEQILITRIDIDDIYQKEQSQIRELQNAMEKIRLASKIKDEFISRMSHDLRTPMNVIIGMTALAREDIFDPASIKEYLDKTESASKYLLALINDCLDFSKMSDGKMEIHPKPYTFAEFKSDINTIVTPLCEQKNIRFVFSGNNINEILLTDHIRMEQIFVNLLTNAVKFTPEGGKIEFLIENIVYGDDFIEYDSIVRDNGIGISEEFQQHMFEPFSQEITENTMRLQGTGLGLSIVKNLVELMGGTLSVKSKLNEGTEFTIHLGFPVVKKELKAETAADNKKHDNQICLQGKRILIVEDHPLNMQIASRLLKKQGMLVECAANGKLGLDMFANSDIGYYDIIMMDIRMPVMDGMEATKSIRMLTRADAKTIPIVAMSANAVDNSDGRIERVGMNEYLEKPINPEKLYRSIGKYVCN